MDVAEIIVGEISVCEDCMYMHANGEIDPDRPADLPAPWSRIRFGETVTMGGSHTDLCPNFPEWVGAECDCDDLGFAHGSCDGCGDWHAGNRYRFTLWQATRGMLAYRAFVALGDARTATDPAQRMRALDRAAVNRRAIVDLYGMAA